MPQRSSVLWVIAQYWPGLSVGFAILLAFMGWMASNGFIDGVVHLSTFERLRWQVEEGARMNAEAHTRISSDMGELKSGVSKIIDAQRAQNEALIRLEASKGK